MFSNHFQKPKALEVVVFSFYIYMICDSTQSNKAMSKEKKKKEKKRKRRKKEKKKQRESCHDAWKQKWPKHR